MKDRYKIYLSLALLYAAFIFYLSSTTGAADPGKMIRFLEHFVKQFDSTYLEIVLIPFYFVASYPDKAAHASLYAGFGFILFAALRNSPYQSLRKHAFIFTMIIGTVYGASDEFHQSFVPGKIMNVWDLLADSVGLAVASSLLFIGSRLSGKKIKVSTFDLKLVLIFILLSIVFILLPPYNQNFLRIVFALPFLLFLPGYLFITAMFPKKGELSPIERFTLSIGLSIAIFVFDGFALNYTPWGFRPNSIVISLTLIMLILLAAAYFRRRMLEEQAYYFSTEHIKSFYRTLRSKETESGPDYDPALEKMLIKTMIIAILIVSAMLIYAKVTNEPEKFTALYILGENGKAENYPGSINIGEPASVLVGVENYEHTPVNYTLRVQLGGRTLKEQNIALDHEKKWLDSVAFLPQLTSSTAFANRSKLEFIILKDNKSYRSVHLWVNTSLDKVKFAELPKLTNGDMEWNDGWIFSASGKNITGNYMNNISQSRVYEINFTSEEAGQFGTIYQNLTTYGDAMGLLSFDIRDSEYSKTSYYVFRQALLDGQVIWESGTGGKNSTWEHIEIPVLFSGNNTLAFRVYAKYRTNYNVTMWLDNIKIRSYGTLLRSEDVSGTGDLEVKFSGFYKSRSDNLSQIKLSVKNSGTDEKRFDLKPAPMLIDELGNKYPVVKIEKGSQIAQTTIYPGVFREGYLFFKPVNSSANDLQLILYINGEKYEFSFKAEPEILEDVKEASFGETIYNSGFEVGLYSYQNTQDWYSNVNIAVKNIAYEEKPFKLSPPPVLVDDLGNQYDMVKVPRASVIEQTTIYPGVIRKGNIYFSEIKPGAKNLTLMLYLNGEKYPLVFTAEPKTLKDDLFSTKSINITSSANYKGIGETVSNGVFNVSLTGHQNTPDWASKVVIAVKNMGDEEIAFKLNPPPVLLDDLGNQYDIVNIGRGDQIKQTVIYPEVIKKGSIFFKPIASDANYLRLIMYLNGERFIFGFKAEPTMLMDKSIHVDTIKNAPDASMGETISQGGFEVKLKDFQNTPEWLSSVSISVRNTGNENKLFKFNSSTVLLDDLGTQYEMVNLNRGGQIEQTTIIPSAQKEGDIFFEPIKKEAKYIRLILRISSEKYVFGFEQKYNTS